MDAAITFFQRSQELLKFIPICHKQVYFILKYILYADFEKSLSSFGQQKWKLDQEELWMYLFFI